MSYCPDCKQDIRIGGPTHTCPERREREADDRLAHMACSRSSDYPERIEETWRADAGWQRADEAEAKLEELREAVRNFRDVSGRHHTKMAAERLIALLPENDRDLARRALDSE